MEHILAKDLRDAVLQAALEGKLTTREQNDSCINETLLEINNDINIKLKNKEIKKLPLFEDRSEDYDSLPDKWIGVRLGQISYFISKGTTPRGGNVAYVDNGIGFLRAENVAGYDKLSFENLKYVTAEMNEGFLQRSKLQENDILITIAGTLGRTGLVRKSDLPLNANQAVSIVRTYPEKLNLRYLIMAINAPSVQKSFLDLTRTTAIPNLTLEIISNIYIPLPPIEEQQRIVDKVDELMAKIDEYEKIENQLVQLKEEFPGDMRDAILQAAMQGKITKTEPNDSNVFDIKIKHENLDELDFDVPEKWSCAKMINVSTVVTGNSIPEAIKKAKYMNIKDGFNYIGTKDVGFNREITYENGVKIPYNEPNFKYSESGSTLLCIEGGSAGKKIAMTDQKVCYGNKLCSFYTESINKKYLYYYLQSPQFSSVFVDNLSGMIGGVSINKLKEIILPIPPIEEQQRIVDLLDKVLPLCDGLN